jgi:predicted TIM-barrel fold metal-dependent hydrolase
VLRWSRFPQVVMKVSAVPAPDQYPHRDPAAVVKQVTAAFGAERLMAGGGFRAGGGAEAYKAERERVRAYLGHLSAAEQGQVFGGTAARVLGFRG